MVLAVDERLATGDNPSSLRAAAHDSATAGSALWGSGGSVETLSRLLQGVIDAPVNQGVKTFVKLLRPGLASSPEVERALCKRLETAESPASAGRSRSADLTQAAGALLQASVRRLGRCLTRHVIMLAQAMTVHDRCRPLAMQPMHEFLQTRFVTMCGFLRDEGVPASEEACIAVSGAPPQAQGATAGGRTAQGGGRRRSESVAEDPVARTIATRKGAAALAGLFAQPSSSPTKATAPKQAAVPATIAAEAEPLARASPAMAPQPSAEPEAVPPQQPTADVVAAGGFEFSDGGWMLDQSGFYQ
jgi:hypothetical protein